MQSARSLRQKPHPSRKIQGLPVGVSLLRKPHTRNGVTKYSYAWAAYWSENCKQIKKAFSIRDNGFRVAFLMAVETRKGKTGEEPSREEILAGLRLESVYRDDAFWG
jgi:hypothetical protein